MGAEVDSGRGAGYGEASPLGLTRFDGQVHYAA